MNLLAPGPPGPPASGPPYADPLRAGAALLEAAATGRLDLPLPGGGATLRRWEALAGLSRQDASLGRLAEGHTDAVAILAELEGTEAEAAGSRRARQIELWGVWSAEPPSARVTAILQAGVWQLSGRKAWCSGASVLDQALVSAHAADGRRLFAIDVSNVQVDTESWPAVGMAGSGTYTVELARVAAEPVGGPGAYLSRAGFWHGGIGVAACWYGVACGIADTLLAAGPVLAGGAGLTGGVGLTGGQERAPDPHGLAHLGAVDAILGGLHAELAQAAAEVDADPLDAKGRAEHLARRVRARVEAGATQVLDHVGRALGAGPLCLSAAHAQRAADLPVYLRQSHAERDLAELGRLALSDPSW